MAEAEPPAEDVADDRADRSVPASTLISWGTLAGIVLVAVAASVARLLALDRFPGGLADAEAAHALLARQSSDFGLGWAIENAGELSIPLVSLIALVGGVGEFDATAPRMAAGLAGGASVLFTGLWLRREIGPLWGVAGAAVLAGSFWHVLFSRIALGQISGALAMALGLWALSTALARRGPAAMPWHLLFGVATGLAFLAAPTLRLLPLLIPGILAVSLYRHWRAPERTDARGWLVATAATWLTISPFLIGNRGDLQLWTPWAPAPGLPGEDRASLLTLPGAIIEGVTGLALPGEADRGLNLPADPWFSLLMLPWAIIGLLGLIGASNDPALKDRFLAGTAGVAALLIGVSAIDSGHPGHYLAVSPLLAGLVVYGFRTALGWARMPTVRVALALLIVFGIGAEASFSWDQYRHDWSREPETQAAFNAGLVDALEATADLPPGEPVFVNVTGREEVLGYFVTTGRRHTFDGRRVLPFPAQENGFLANPHASPQPGSLEQLLADAPLINFGREDRSHDLYRLDGRIRQQMPFGVPTFPYNDGPILYGGQIARIDGRAVTALIAWNLPAGSKPYQVDVRLSGGEVATDENQTTVDLPENPLTTRLFQVVVAEVEAPDDAGQVDLAVRLLEVDGDALTTGGADPGAFVFLSRYELPE